MRTDCRFETPEEGDREELKGAWNVYFLSLVDPAEAHRDFGLIKVGITEKDVERRIAQLQTGNPYQIRCEASFSTPVARQVEHWVHRTNAARLVQLEWLRLTRPEVLDLVRAAREEGKRLAQISEAEARWSHSRSNSKERPAGAEETRLQEATRDVLSRLSAVTLQLRYTRASMALLVGAVLRIPGIVRIDLIRPAPSFNPRVALEMFPDLAVRHRVESIGGQFRWRNVPKLDSPERIKLREDVEHLEEQQHQLERSILDNPSGLHSERERTDQLARLHQDFLALTQQEARLELDKKDLQAQMIQWMEDFEAITGVCSFGRFSRPKLDGKSFCEAYPTEAAACSSERKAYVRWTIYASRSY